MNIIDYLIVYCTSEICCWSIQIQLNFVSVWPKIYDDICEWNLEYFYWFSYTMFSKTKGGGREKKGKSQRGESKKERKEKRECYSFMVFVMQVEKKKIKRWPSHCLVFKVEKRRKRWVHDHLIFMLGTSLLMPCLCVNF